MFDLAGKRAIVTGSTKGIGRAIAEAFARAGAKVVISSRKPDACDKVAGEIADDGGEVLSIPCHVGHRAQLEKLVSKTANAWGGVDILVCNAATNPVYGPMAAASDEAFEKIMQTNVQSVFQLCNMVCPLMADQGGGSVIVISSIAGLRGNMRSGPSE